MKKVILLIFVATLILSCQGGDNTVKDTGAAKSGKVKIKRYQVPSGMVEYALKIDGNMGAGKITGHGVSKLYFKDYGAVELQEEQSEQVTEINMFGQSQKQTDKVHKMSKLDNGVSYSVDFKAKKIYKMQDPAMGFFKSFKKGDVAGSMEDIMKSMGAKKIGTEKVLGYPCDVWEMNGVKIWMYKGVPLKSATEMMGIRYVNEAVKAEFGKKIPDKYFRLPDFEITEQPAIPGYRDDTEDDGMPAGNGKLLDYDAFRDAMTKENPDMPEEFINQAYTAYLQMNQK